jgi:hypothetical protein
VRDPSDNAWFYTHKGGRHGPVALRDLKKLADSGQLDPRYDMCWTYGMADWRPAGEIEGLFIRRAAAADGRPRGIAGRLAGEDMDATPVLFRTGKNAADIERLLRESDWPGVSRFGYLFALWVLPLLMAFCFVWLVPYLASTLDPGSMKWIKVVSICAGVLFVWFLIVLSLQRLTNLGMSRWWFLGNFVPGLSLWVAYRTMCCPSGYSFHGKLDGMGVLLALVYWGVMMTLCASFAVGTATHLGYLHGGVFEDLRLIIETYTADPSVPVLPPGE